MVALHFLYYNFARIHKSLRITPAMAAGLSDHVWSLEEIAMFGGIISVYNYTVMDTPVRDHIRRLEWKIEALTEEVMRNRLDQSERNHIEAEIRAANLALSHYKSALEIEQRLELSN